jgi:phosphatidylinositol kinase/protein kinase (PI-3  family)
MLPIPELVPFRLTPQLIGALEPLGVSGILEVAMINILEGEKISKKLNDQVLLIICLAIRDDKELLLNIMDIFVKEPLLDWKKAAVKQAKDQSNDNLEKFY